MRSALSIGNFDGLHLGHRELLERLVGIARDRGLRSIVITYDNHPSQVLNSHSLPLLLLPAEQKRNEILSLGIDQVEMLHFDESVAKTSADEFLHGYIMPAFNPAAIVVGYDSHFGHGRQGNFGFLQSHASNYGYELFYVDPIQYGNRVVSSSLIREMLILGDLKEANILLGRPYSIFGCVEGGSALGRRLGFPTANIRLQDSHQLVPRSGVYLSRVDLAGEQFFGLTNIGTSPTLKHGSRTEIETHIIDFDRQIYGSRISVGLLQYLREERLFASKEELIDAMGRDLDRARELIAAGGL